MNSLTVYLQILKQIKNKDYFPPCHNWPDYQFRIRSYERAALDEIVEAIKKAWPRKSPVDVLYDYYSFYNALLYSTDDMPEETEQMLVIKCEVAEDVGYYFV